MKHLEVTHNITSDKTQAHQRHITKLSKQLEISSLTFKDEPMRWFKVMSWSMSTYLHLFVKVTFNPRL